MDKSGYRFSQGGSERVLVPDGDKAALFKAQLGSREMATVIECIGSGGQVFPAMIITKGKIHTVGEQQRMEGIPTSWQFAKSVNGWSTNDLAIQWLEKVFDATTRPSTPSEYRLHTNLTFINTCWSHHIIPFLLPPHSTHILQPLDVSIFGPLTAAYRRIINNVAAHVDSDIDKAQFSTFYAQAREQALTQMTARKAFSNLGITTTPSAEKVLARLPGGTTQTPQIPPLKDTLNIPSTNASVNAMLDDFKDSTEQRDQRQLKRTLLQAYEALQATISVLQAENTVLRTQEEQQRKTRKKVKEKDTGGDQRILSKERMISWEDAERQLVAKGPAVSHGWPNRQRREEDLVVLPSSVTDDDDDDEEDDDGKSILAAFMGTCRRPVRTYGHRLDGKQPLNAVEDTAADANNLYDSVPVASSSRIKL
ncbi:hypothetical protein NDA16_002093 [Ustilago loliicola]|nr:hypothetical protein NDA16_002093 [Ustilago loliicola]